MNLQNEIYRKSLHLLLIIIPLAFCVLGKWKFLFIVSPIAAVVVALDYFRHKKTKINDIFLKIFAPVLREHELQGDKLCGASWVALATLVTFLFFKKEIAVTGFFILVISDAAAALIGKSIKSEPFFEKTFAGATAFFCSGFVILLTCAVLFHMGFWFYLFGSFSLFCVTVLESRPSLLKMDDNFVIPVFFSAILTFFDIIWNYNY